jgi:cation diffusion facilitator family transporter
VLTDALTSVLAILALLAAKYFGFVWMDPLMGIVGAILVARWSIGLLKSTSAILLDKQAPLTVQNKIKQSIESDGESQVADLHVWSIGPNIHAAIISVLTNLDKTPEDFKTCLPEDLGLEHVSIEVKNLDGSSS